MAKAFRFRLDRLLRLRKLVEDARIRDLGSAGTRLQRAQQERAGAEEKKDRSLTALSELFQEGPLDLGLISSAHLSLRAAKQGVQEAGDRVLDQAAAREEARQAYVVASRDMKVLSRLRDQREKEHLSEIERWEQKLLDEAGARRR